MKVPLVPGASGPAKLPSAYGPAKWLPDGRHFVAGGKAVSADGSRLVLADSLSSSMRLLLAADGPVISLDVSPDGRRVAYFHGYPEWRLAEYSITGQRLRDLGEGSIGRWSPGGDRIVYRSRARNALLTVRADGGDESHVDEASFAGKYSPDGKRIAVLRSVSNSLAVYPAAGGRPVILVNSSVGGYCWSSDGEWIWFDQSGRMMKVPSQGGAAMQTGREGSVFDCSPDGSVAYATENGEFQILAPDGKTLRPLLPGFTAPWAAFGNGGRVFYGVRLNRRSVAAIDTKSGALLKDIEIELDPADMVGSISIHPDGKRMLLTTGNVRYNIAIAEGFAQPETGWRSWFRHWRIAEAPPAQAGEERTPE